MSRNGKIARLPRNLREEVNLKLDNNVQGEEVLAWLNALPETKKALEGYFDGVEVTKQNLSDWRQGGFREWSLRRDIFEEACELPDAVGDLARKLDPALIAANLTAVLSAHYARALAGWDGKFNEELEKDALLLRLLIRDVALLQRTSHQAERQEAESDQRQEEAQKKEYEERKAYNLAPVKAAMRQRELSLLYKCDGMPKAAEVACYVACIEHDQKAPSLAEIWELPDGDLSELLQQLQGPVVPSQGQSRHHSGKRAEKASQRAKRDNG